MSSFNDTRATWLPQREIAFGAIGAAYAPVGAALTEPARQFLIFNGTNALLQFSTNNADDHFVIPANGFYLNDISSNSARDAQGFIMEIGDQLFVKQIGVATSGSVYFCIMVGKG